MSVKFLDLIIELTQYEACFFPNEVKKLFEIFLLEKKYEFMQCFSFLDFSL